jgi:hypothetical protein
MTGRVHYRVEDRKALCGEPVSERHWEAGDSTLKVFSVTCKRCLRSIVKRVPEAQAQLDWLASQRKED